MRSVSLRISNLFWHWYEPVYCVTNPVAPPHHLISCHCIPFCAAPFLLAFSWPFPLSHHGTCLCWTRPLLSSFLCFVIKTLKYCFWGGTLTICQEDHLMKSQQLQLTTKAQNTFFFFNILKMSDCIVIIQIYTLTAANKSHFFIDSLLTKTTTWNFTVLVFLFFFLK